MALIFGIDRFVFQKKTSTNLLDTQNELAQPYQGCVHNTVEIPKTSLWILQILNYHEGTHFVNTLKEETQHLKF